MSFSDFKEVTSNNVGSSTRYGGNDLKEVMQILNNKVVSSRRVSIKNPLIFTDSFDMKPPVGTPASPTDTNASRIYADPSDAKIKVKKQSGTVIDIENLNIANSALNTITDKTKLHSSIVYGDQNNSRGAFWEDWVGISAPSNPAAGSRRIFVDSTNGELSVRTSGGITVSLESFAAAGDVMLNATNTYGDFDSIFRSSRVKIRNPANTFSYSMVGSAIAAARNVTLPLLTADDTLVTAAFSQTLTTKTINADQNTIKDSTTNAAGDLLKGDATKFVRFARGTPNQVLSVNAGGTDLVWATPAGGGNVSTTGSNTYGDFDQIFRSGRLDLSNPANTFNYSITGSAIVAARAITLPLLTAGDTFVMEAFTQTLTNKTVNATNNTITDTSQATGDILKNNGTKFVRMARGTSLQVLRTNSGATDLEFASLDSERVGKHQANGNASTTVFNIAHGLGSLPTYAFISVAQSGSTSLARSYTMDATNIVVTFASAPSSGTNNVVIYWRVVA
jgi:hypothetical protein